MNFKKLYILTIFFLFFRVLWAESKLEIELEKEFLLKYSQTLIQNKLFYDTLKTPNQQIYFSNIQEKYGYVFPQSVIFPITLKYLKPYENGQFVFLFKAYFDYFTMNYPSFLIENTGNSIEIREFITGQIVKYLVIHVDLQGGYKFNLTNQLSLYGGIGTHTVQRELLFIQPSDGFGNVPYSRFNLLEIKSVAKGLIGDIVLNYDFLQKHSVYVQYREGVLHGKTQNFELEVRTSLHTASIPSINIYQPVDGKVETKFLESALGFSYKIFEDSKILYGIRYTYLHDTYPDSLAIVKFNLVSSASGLVSDFNELLRFVVFNSNVNEEKDTSFFLGFQHAINL
jgi:hypothetical protein